MYFPKYWSRGKGNAAKADGDAVEAEAWGWSDASEADAASKGAARARGLAEAIARGEAKGQRYLYGSNPLREPILEQIGSVAVVTRNGYGSEVLNTSGVLFCDIDLPAQAPATKLTGLLSLLFGRKSGPPATPEGQALEKVGSWVEMNRSWGIDAYRTKAGLRLIATHALFDPCGGEAETFFEAVGADPYFRKLCQVQKSFRARLTPKFWRCGIRRAPPPWPFRDPGAQRRFEDWQRNYLSAAAGYAVCAKLEHIGAARVQPDAQTVIKLHDGRTRADSGLPLA